MSHPTHFFKASWSMPIAALSLCAVTFFGSWTAEAVDLEPPNTFDAVCAAAHSDLIDAREYRFRARRTAKQARAVFERCKAELRLGNVSSCRRQERKVKESISYRNRAESEFQDAAIKHRKECARDKDN